ncbi:hypothetical protein THICB1_160035 [Thiomonas arsenitoxydans]|uniref:PHD-type domain-containing protein n=1 Tax=Thiomonas arsenitoxydans (strain DSM 22701 / CIP 110005 / 3As) TaxID=426114 RepID=A0ABM9T5P3_THIA3|nr:hypothetical protein THICB1_160035 [Thiomonas arsenitoxydans]CQR36536.1 hypothetical protein THICB6_260035 [Thiomonas arsenitoxydans]
MPWRIGLTPGPLNNAGAQRTESMRDAHAHGACSRCQAGSYICAPVLQVKEIAWHTFCIVIAYNIWQFSKKGSMQWKEVTVGSVGSWAPPWQCPVLQVRRPRRHKKSGFAPTGLRRLSTAASTRRWPTGFIRKPVWM